MPRCSPERMFPSSQWWRCRCYIDTFLLWDSPREFPTSSTAYHSNLYIAPSELFSVTWHHPQWRRELREVSQNDLTISELRSSGFVNYSLLDCRWPRWPSSRCHMPSAVRPVQIQPFQVGRLIVLTCDCLELSASDRCLLWENKGSLPRAYPLIHYHWWGLSERISLVPTGKGTDSWGQHRCNATA